MSKKEKLKKTGRLLLILLLVFNTAVSAHYVYRKIEARIIASRPEPEPAEEPVPQSVWDKYPGSPVLGDESTGSLFDPFVIRYDGEYHMYVSDRKNGSIALSTSKDGVNWSSLTQVLEKNRDSGWEDSVNRCSTAVHDGTWYLYYTGQQNGVSRIGAALSTDGIHFERVGNDCILSPSSALEGSSVMDPFVIYDVDEGLFKMWYSAGETHEPDVICYATSKDGINFERYKYNPVFSKGTAEYDRAKVAVGHVEKVSKNEYLMFYIGYENEYKASICIARSEDGIRGWERYEKNPIIVPSPDSWDQSSCYRPAVVFDSTSGKWMLWYNGRNETSEYIGLATYSKSIY